MPQLAVARLRLKQRQRQRPRQQRFFVPFCPFHPSVFYGPRYIMFFCSLFLFFSSICFCGNSCQNIANHVADKALVAWASELPTNMWTVFGVGGELEMGNGESVARKTRLEFSWCGWKVKATLSALIIISNWMDCGKLRAMWDCATVRQWNGTLEMNFHFISFFHQHNSLVFAIKERSNIV